MKKTMLFAVMALISVGCFAQKANVKKARNLIQAETPDYNTARQLMDEALVNPETAGLADTWYVAGLIGYQQSELEFNKRFMGQQVDFNVMGKAQQESLEAWAKADELASVLVQDKKGNMVMDKKNVTIKKNIATKILDYWDNQGLLGYAGNLYENKDYAGTYQLYKLYIDIPNMPIMQDEKSQVRMVRDTNYLALVNSTGMLAYSAELYPECIEVFSTMLHGDYKAEQAGEYIYSCYLNMKDSAKAYAVMDECIELFPNDARFLQQRINVYIGKKEYEQAIDLLDKAIAQDAQAQYFNSKGSILTMLGKYDEAIEIFKQGLAIDANNVELYINYGYVYVEKGNKLNDEATYLSSAEYKKARKEIDATYKNALPLFDKAHQLDVNNDDCTRTLKSLYYRLGMTEEYNALQ